MKIALRPHLKIRLIERAIPQDYLKKILSNPDSRYFDPLTNHSIAIKSLKYYGKIRPMVVAYDIIRSEIQVITVYPTNNQEILNRIKSGRWIKNEKN